MNPSPIRSSALTLAAALAAAAGFAHVTPNVKLVPRGEFLRESLPGAAQFFEKPVSLSPSQSAELHRSVGWSPKPEDTRVYVGRDAAGRSVGTVEFLWMAWEHGPVAVGVAFDPQGTVTRVEVTDAAEEPLVWLRPIIAEGGLRCFTGLPLSAEPQPDAVTAHHHAGPMSRFCAKVLCEAVSRAQALERVLLHAGEK
jgi:hypothetical protein